MTKSELFRKAHALAKQVIKTGDDYRITFGACIKSIRTELRKLVFAAWTVDFLKVVVGTETADFIQYANNLGGKKRGDFWLFAKRDGKGAIEMLREVYGDVKVVTQL